MCGTAGIRVSRLSHRSLPAESIGTMGSQANERIRELEKKLIAVVQERDDLLKDVEALAISNGSSMFSSSYVLSERVSAVDIELKEARAAIVKLTEDRERHMDELSKLKISKLAADTLGAQQGARLEGLEKDVAYYQVTHGETTMLYLHAVPPCSDAAHRVSHASTSCQHEGHSCPPPACHAPNEPLGHGSLPHAQVQLSKSVAERDRALFESEQLRGQAARAELGFKEERARAEAEAAARASLEQQLGSLRESGRQLRQELDALTSECEEARRKLRQAAEEKRRLDAVSSSLQVCVSRV